MANDYYPELEEDDAPSPQEQAKPEGKTAKGDSALLPRSIVGEMGPGDEFTVRIVRVFDDEVEVEKVKARKPTATREPTFEEEIDALDMEE